MHNKLTLKKSIELIKDKELSSKELAQACLDSIEAKDKFLHAYVSVNENILKEAGKADNGEKTGLLRGIPIAYKDNFLTRVP